MCQSASCRQISSGPNFWKSGLCCVIICYEVTNDANDDTQDDSYCDDKIFFRFDVR